MRPDSKNNTHQLNTINKTGNLQYNKNMRRNNKSYAYKEPRVLSNNNKRLNGRKNSWYTNTTTPILAGTGDQGDTIDIQVTKQINESPGYEHILIKYITLDSSGQ